MTANGFRTAILLGALTGLMLWVGQVVGGPQGLTLALVFAVVMNVGSLWFSDKIVLRMHGAKAITESEAPELFRIVQELTQLGRMPMPALYVISSDAPNAFATGRNPEHAAVAVTSGILRMLSAAELRGVLAHELAHVKNRDTLTSTVAAILAGVIMFSASMARWGMIFGGMGRNDRDGEGGGLFSLLVMVILAPMAAMVIQMAISRSREFAADATAARMTSDPLSLASALERLSDAASRVPLDANPQTAHLFIVNPLRRSTVARLFSTHPPTEERVRRLRAREY